MSLAIFVLLTTLALVTGESEPRSKQLPCEEDSLCNGKSGGPFVYSGDDQFFYFCSSAYLDGSGKKKNAVNMGCLQCAERDTFFSLKCNGCESRYNVDNGICTSQPPPKTTVAPDDSPDLSCVEETACLGVKDGTFRVKSDKTKFYSCFEDHVSQCQSCPAFTYYAEPCGSCEYEDIVDKADCPVVTTKDTPLEYCDTKFCDTRPDGDYEKAAKSNTYFTCTAGSCIPRRCPGKSYFAEVCGKCGNYTTNADECPKEEKDDGKTELVLCGPSFCKGKTDGRYAVANSRDFYVCQFVGTFNEQCIMFKCPEDSVFNEEKDMCE